MRLIDTDVLQYRRKDYSSYDDVSDEERRRGIVYILKEDIDSAPTIDPVKHGKWVKIEGLSSDYYCSECEQKWWTPFPEEMHYCPNCGARMDGEE